MKKSILKVCIITLSLFIQCKCAYASSNAVNDLQNFLNGYVVSAGRIICLLGTVEIATSFASLSSDKKFRGLRMFGIGLTLISINDIINVIFS